ncbi:MAG: nucleotide exchange factor GrpE [Xanthobacteraceae bacterium]|jgi:molecular chaperone GrpE
MTDQTARVEEDGQETQAGPSQQAQAPAPSTALEREHAEMKDRLLRTLAEMENLRKRTEREIADSRLYSVTSFARDLLVVADNMRRALEAVTPELRSTAESGVKALIDGIELTERELLKGLEKNGVRQFTPQSEKFDPNLHQAMFEIADATVPAGSVAQVVQPGYMIGDRVLRPALVGVSKGGPKAAPGAPGNNNAKTAKEPARKS